MTETLTVLQLNCQNSGPVTDKALQTAFEQGVQVVALQKPWTCVRDGRWLLKLHPSYRLYTTTDAKLRYATYVSQALTSTYVSPPGPY